MNPTLLRVSFGGVLVVLLLVYLLVNVASGQGRLKGVVAGHDYHRTIVRDGRARKYFVHVPVGYDSTKQWPLVLVLHGGGGNGSKVADLTGFSARADADGFIVAYPDAVNGHWNDGRAVRRFKSQREGIDDVAFVAALIDRFESDLGADPKRVYVTGMSNGAMMCHRLACELSDRIAAIAPVAGTLPENMLDASKPSRPVSVLLINGTADPLVPYDGGGVGLVAKRGEVISAPRTAAFWAGLDGCSARPGQAQVLDVDPKDGMRVVVESFGLGRDSSEVLLYTVEGGGHTWPSGGRRNPQFGKTARDINATEVIWDFFRRHHR